jgi:hypothetical protein
VRMIGKASSQQRPVLAALAWLVFTCAARADVVIPSVGQPTPFYGAAGKGVKIEASVSANEITQNDTILYTFRITNLLNAANVQHPNLAEMDEYNRDFQIEDEPTTEREPDGTRIFHYRLRPRRASLIAIPGFAFPYYDPNLPQPADRPEFPFRKARTEPIAIRIVASKEPPRPPIPLDVPAFAESLAEPSVRVPAFAWWIGIVLPPLLALALCTLWWLRNPAGARLSRHRRSRSARNALKRLHALGRKQATPDHVVECVCHYLAEHYDLPRVARTSGDLEDLLREARASEETIRECLAFLRAGDEARFAPNPIVTTELLIAEAEHLIRRQEGEG